MMKFSLLERVIVRTPERVPYRPVPIVQPSSRPSRMFDPLHRMFPNDPERVRRMLGVFVRVTQDDLERLERARTSGDWAEVRQIAHRIRSACAYVGESAAAELLGVVEAAAPHPTDEQFDQTRAELDGMLVRVASHLAGADARF
jgi:HPt (histidine-containing phosphotransfer) domain-containing protein